MKKLIPLCLALAFVSCGRKSSDIPTVTGFFDQLNASHYVGMVTISKSKSSYRYPETEYSGETRKVNGFKIKTSESEYRDVLIHKAGNTIYTARLKADGEIEYVESITISSPTLEDIQAADPASYRMGKNSITFFGTDEDRDDYFGDGSLIIETVENYEITKMTSACQSSSVTQETKATANLNGEIQNLELLASTMTETCGEPYSIEKIKEMDLRDVEYCNNSDESESESSGGCKKANLSWLTANY